MKTIPFNINDCVLVKLKPEGYSQWMKFYNRHLSDEHKKSLVYYTAQANPDGYVRFQMHAFMEIFGPNIKIWELPVFETRILIEVPE